MSIDRTLHRKVAVALALAIALLGVSPSSFAQTESPSPSPVESEARIRDARAESNEAIREHDADRVASFFTDDYSLVASTNLSLQGREPNRESFRAHFEDRADVVYVRTPREIGFYEPWGMAYEIGDWQGSFSDAEGEVRIGGTYLAKWQHLEGRWLIRAEVFVPTRCEGTSYCDAR